MYTNTDQFVNKRDDLCALICSNEPDVILLTETIPKAQRLPMDLALLHIPGYVLYINFTPSIPNLGKSGKRGICVYVSHRLKVAEVSLDAVVLEHLWVRISLRGSDSLLIGCLYRSPSSDPGECTCQLRQLFQQASSQSTHLVIVGDFNFPHIDWETGMSLAPDSTGSHLFLEALHDHFLFQHVRQPTRYRLGETPNILDLVLSNEEDMVRNIEFLPGLGSSDHVILQFSVACYSVIRPDPFPFHTRTNYELLNNELKACDWSLMDDMEVEDAHQFFKDSLAEAITKSSKRRKARPKRSLYMNRKAFQLRKRKQSLWGAYCQSQNPLDHARFVRCRNDLRGLTRKLRKEHEQKLAAAIKGNPKAFWRYASSRLRTRSRVEDLKDVGGRVASSNQEKADMLSDFFCSMFTAEEEGDLPTPPHIFNGTALVDVDVSPQKVEAKLSALKPNSSPGPDGIHSRVLREASSVLAGPLSTLFRKSIDSKKLPADWKSGEITPIHKKGDRRNPANYRPISLTAIPCKVLESIVRDHLLEHLMSADLMHPSQHGFLPRRSCTTQLMEVMEAWTAAVEEGDPVDVVYLDFAKAFDSVPHQRLLCKLESHGISGKLLDWIAAFLVGRQQRVMIQGSKSAWAPVTSGVPQGSVLGPTLFTIFVNDIPTQVDSSVQLFADDTKLYRRVSDGKNSLQADIDALVNWSEEWLLPFNASKCKVMHVGSQNPEQSYHLKNVPVEVVEEEKDLGIIVDSHMKFKHQASAAVSKASQMLAVVRRSFANIDQFTLPLLFKTIVRPHLEYGNSIWGPFNKGDQKLVERVQRRATKMVDSVRRLSYPERLRQLGLPSLHYRRRRGDMIAVYQVLHGGMDVPPDLLPTRNDSGRTRGHPWKLDKPRATTLTRRNSFSVRTINDWNALPASVVSAESLNAFKARLDRHWANKMYDTPFT